MSSLLWRICASHQITDLIFTQICGKSSTKSCHKVPVFSYPQLILGSMMQKIDVNMYRKSYFIGGAQAE